MKTLLRLGLLLCLFQMQAQVGINTTTPDAQLDIKASSQAAPTNKDGLLIPRVDAFPATNPTASQQGMLVYLTTTVGTNTPGYYYWDNITTSWIGIVSTTNGDKDWYKAGTTLTPSNTEDMYHMAKVGVGLTNPLSPLHVKSSASGLTPNPSALASIESSDGTYFNLLSGAESGLLFGANSVATNGGIIYNSATIQNGFMFRTNNNLNRMILNSTGYLGIGGNNPQVPLHFTDNTIGEKIALYGDSTYNYGLGVQGNLFQIHSDLVGSDIAFGHGSSASFTENVRFRGNGYVGLGVYPTLPLQFPFTLGDKVAFYGGAGAHYGIGIQHQLLQIHADLLNSDIAFGYGSSSALTERMRIKGTGNVGIGTSSPSSRLHVQNGSSGMTPNANSQLTVEGSSTGVYTNLLSTQETGVLFGSSGQAEHGGIIYNAGYSGPEGPNTMSFRTGGNANRMIIGSTGKVALGNFIPSVQLEFDNVHGEKICLFGQTGAMYGFGIQSALLQMYTPASNNDIAFGYGTTDALTERMRIKGTGNVGIGTSAPSSKLHVQNGSSTITANGSALITAETSGTNAYMNVLSTQETGVLFGASGASNNGGVVYNSPSYPNGLLLRTGGNTNRMVIGSTGNVAIGNFAPDYPLHFPSSVGDKISLWGSAGAHYGFGIQGFLMQIHSAGSSDDIAFGYGSSAAFTENVRIKGTGEVGIGTNAPTAELEVNGFTKMGGSTAPAVKMIKLTGTTSTTQGGFVQLVHGLTSSKILSASVLVEYSSGNSVPPSYTASAGYEYDYYVSSTSVVVWNKTANSANILTKPIRVLVTYEE